MAYEVFETCMLVPGLSRAECASWVQAWGSIAAILVAVWLANAQIRHARKLEEDKQIESDVQRLEVLRALMARAHNLAKNVGDAFTTLKDEDFEHVDAALMFDTHLTLDEIPIFDVPEGFLALDVRTVSRGLLHLSEMWTLFMREKPAFGLNTPTTKNVQVLAKEVGEIAYAAFDDCRKHIVERRAGMPLSKTRKAAPTT
jgi:hypothetical protein